MYSEDELLPISSLQHLIFCERRAMLVLVEGLWGENIFTAEGRHVHERADDGQIETRRDVRVARGLRLRSLKLGLTGKADVVEFHLDTPYPVEYKRGHLRREEGYEIQLCAQAICLEEMLGIYIPEGALFFGKPRRRLNINFDDGLRLKTEVAAARLHELTKAGRTPTARYEKKCESCSLLDHCMPKAVGRRMSVERYLTAVIADATDESGGA